VWVSDDAKRIPVQIRLRLAFPIGNGDAAASEGGSEMTRPMLLAAAILLASAGQRSGAGARRSTLDPADAQCPGE